jgi:hypothetical protein
VHDQRPRPGPPGIDAADRPRVAGGDGRHAGQAVIARQARDPGLSSPAPELRERR